MKSGLFKNSIFVRMFISSSISTLGDRLVIFILPLWIMNATGSSTKVALINALITVVTVILTPLTGTLADRVSRRKLMILADILRMSIMFILGLMTALNLFNFEFILFLIIIRALGTSLSSPASNAALITFVDKEHLNAAIGLRQTMNQVVNIGAPMLGGVLVGFVSFGGVFWIDSLTFMISILILMTLKFPREINLKKKQPFWSDFNDGLRGITKKNGLKTLLISAGIVNVLGASLVVTLQVFVVRAEFSTIWWSIIFTSSPAGVVLGAVFARVLKLGKETMSNAFIFVAIMGVFNLAMGFVESPLTFSFLFFLSGIAFGVSNVNFGVLYREKIEIENQGRFFGFLNSILLIAVPVGQVVVGVSLEVVNADLIISIIGALTSITALASWYNLRNETLS